MLPRPLTTTLAAALVWTAAAPSVAQEADEVSSVSLIAEQDTVRPGQTLLLGLHFELEDGWHIYWDGFNDTGFPPMVEWSLPEGVSVGPMLWPAPERYISPGNILDHVYEGRPTILVPITVDPSVPAGETLEIRGEVEWLVCNDICLPGFGPISIDLQVAAGQAGTPAQLAPDSRIGRAAASLPQPVRSLEQVEGLSLRWSDDVIAVQVDGAESLAFFPAQDSVSLVSVIGDASSEGETMTLRIGDGASGGNLRGVLQVERAAGMRWYLIDYAVDGLQPPEQTEAISRVRDRVERSPS
ncbi:MAG: protein-disulfide reductase DsbD domain-containing protein [Phycisphaerales bacterium]